MIHILGNGAGLPASEFFARGTFDVRLNKVEQSMMSLWLGDLVKRMIANFLESRTFLIKHSYHDEELVRLMTYPLIMVTLALGL